MSMNELETLRARAAKVELPQSVHDAVMAEATALDAPQQTGRTVSRRSFVRVGAAAAAVGVGAFFGLSIFGKEDTLPVFGDDENERGFVLTAYADGIEQILEPGGDGSIPVKNYALDFGQGPSDIEGMYDVRYSLLVNCKIYGPGSGVISAELEGQHAQDVKLDAFGTEPLIFFNASDAETTNYYHKSVSEGFIVGDDACDVDYPLDLMAHFPMSDALKTAIETGDRRAQYLEARHCFNELLSTCTLHISAIFDEEQYEGYFAIDPIPDFDEQLGAYLDEIFAAEETYGQTAAEARTVRRSWDSNPPMTQDEFLFDEVFNELDEKYYFYTIRSANA